MPTTLYAPHPAAGDVGVVGEQLQLGITDDGVSPDHVDIARHQRQCLLVAMFTQPQGINRLDIAGIAGEVKPTEPFDADDAASGQERRGLRDRIPSEHRRSHQ